MAKIEITVTDEEKARLQAAADRSALKLATWARALMLTEAAKAMRPAYGNDD